MQYVFLITLYIRYTLINYYWQKYDNNENADNIEKEQYIFDILVKWFINVNRYNINDKIYII